MKYVCVCQGGNCRSVAMAYILKSMGHAAVAIGYSHSHSGLMQVLCEWADKVLVMEEYIRKEVPAAFQDKILMCCVGPDVWFGGYNQQLLKKCQKFCEKHGIEEVE